MKTISLKSKKETSTTNEMAKKLGLPEEIFSVPLNTDLVHQITVSQMGNRRQSIAHTKDRSEVRGGGIKPWKQKGTGRARHGSNRSPIWVGGGITFGPRSDKVWEKVVPKKMKRKALFMVLSQKLNDNLLILTDNILIDESKTKKALEFLEKNSIKSESCLVVLPELNRNTILAFANLPKIKTIQAKDLNCLDLLSYKYLLIDKAGIEKIKETFLNLKENNLGDREEKQVN
ncbi:MAG: 50S ribosomal protein L4 [Candidatus Pacebacteria bacterium]|nr:50S ribosomal protein L4 [Candidatus Paceibacterota bacterium]